MYAPTHPHPRFAAPRWLVALAAALLMLPLIAQLRATPGVGSPSSSSPPAPSDATRARVASAYGRLPLHFEPAPLGGEARYVSRGAGYTLHLTGTGAVLSLSRPTTDRRGGKAASADAQVRMRLLGAQPNPRVSGLNELPGTINYMRGSDPSKWRTEVPTYAKVEYRGVYPGIDMVYYGNQRRLEYDFVLAPGADPSAIALGFAGADGPAVDVGGDLVLRVPGGEVRQEKPYAYQRVGGQRREVASRYVLDGGRVHFALGSYDRSLPLVIDPVLAYSTYLGGSGSEGFAFAGIAVDAAGNAYVTADSSSANFPTTRGGHDRTFNGAGTLFGQSVGDAFVTKIDASGSRLIYSTYLGGSGAELGRSISVDAQGEAYVVGYSTSRDFPTTRGAYDRTFNGGATDIFVSKLDARGSRLLYSTYLGGRSAAKDDTEQAFAVAVNGVGEAYVTGQTNARNYPTTRGAYDRAYNGGDADAVVTRLNAAGSGLLYSTFVGGANFDDGFDIALRPGGDAQQVGAGVAYVFADVLSRDFPTTRGSYDRTYNGGETDTAVFALDATGSRLLYSTYLGGGATDLANGIAVDAAGNAYAVGTTTSRNFPTTRGALDRTLGGPVDSYVAKVNPSGSALAYSTYLGGSGIDAANDVAVDARGRAYIAGDTTSRNFPTTRGAPDRTSNGGVDAFVAALGGRGAGLVFGTYLGGRGSEFATAIALGPAGGAQQGGDQGVYVAGDTTSANYPTTRGAYDRTYAGGERIPSEGPAFGGDLFVTKIR